jgi:DNA-binding NarL/FixJ family response regulator
MSELSNNGNGSHLNVTSAIYDVTGTNSLLVQRIANTLIIFGWTKISVLKDQSEAGRMVAPDVLVVVAGRSLPRRDTTISELRNTLQSTRIVLVCSTDSRANVRSAIDSGVDGIVFDTDIEHSLGSTVAAVHAGQVVVPQALCRELYPPTLSGREKQIVGLVVMGLTNKEISQRLFVSESTVKCHLSSVFQKLGVRSRNEAVTMILDPSRKLGLGILGISDNQRTGVEIRP